MNPPPQILLNPPGLFGVGFKTWYYVCLGVAVLYLFLYPKAQPDRPLRSAITHAVIRWAHSLVWVLMAGGCLLAQNGKPSQGKVLALCAFGVYVLFMSVVVGEKLSHRKAPPSCPETRP